MQKTAKKTPSQNPIFSSPMLSLALKLKLFANKRSVFPFLPLAVINSSSCGGRRLQRGLSMKRPMILSHATTSGLDDFGCGEFVTSEYFLRFIHKSLFCLHLPVLALESFMTQKFDDLFNLLFYMCD